MRRRSVRPGRLRAGLRRLPALRRPKRRWAASCANCGLGRPLVWPADQRYIDMHMPSKNAIRVRRSRDKLRASGMRAIQIWVKDARAPGFAEELARQCQVEAAWAESPEGRDKLAFWEELAAETWAEDLG
jgi:Protein  of unknown function (DUF3018)